MVGHRKVKVLKLSNLLPQLITEDEDLTVSDRVFHGWEERLALSWNVCRSVPTEVLRRLANVDSQPAEMFKHLEEAVAILKVQGEHGTASAVQCVSEWASIFIRTPPYSKEPPTAPGWYWVRDEFDRSVGNAGDVVYISMFSYDPETNTTEMCVNGGGKLDPEWDYSPILEPVRGPVASEVELTP